MKKGVVNMQLIPLDNQIGIKTFFYKIPPRKPIALAVRSILTKTYKKKNRR